MGKARTGAGAGLSPPIAMREFRKRCHSILWRQEAGGKKDKITYDRFKRLVAEFQKDGGMTLDQATVEAAKDFQCLKPLFRSYDVGDYDPHPESHADTPKPDKRPKAVKCEDKSLSYREQLAWAMSAAGKFLRVGVEPTTCPNDRAFFLYIQAKEQPKEFMQRLGQVEAKGDTEEEEQRLSKRASKRSVEEIDAMLAELGESDETLLQADDMVAG